MRAELRRLALHAAVTAAAVAVTFTTLAAWLLLDTQADLIAAGRGPLPTWVLGLVALAVLVSSLVVSFLGARAVADRRSAALVGPMRQLAQRAEEFGAGGFVVEALAQLGPDQQLQPPPSGIAEIDTVSRILDRNHRSLQRALSAERSFAADASHQLRTPLAALLLRLEEISAAPDLGHARQEAEIAITQTERLAAVVDDLLHRTRAGHADGGRSVSVDTLLSQLQKEWEPAFDKVGRTLSVRLERGMIVRSSASAISQIFDTLLENALRHGGGAVTVQARRSGPSAVIEVSDEGEGIPRELARRVFVRAVSGGSGGGTGLGLSVARETAESFGGRLELVQARPVVFALYVSMAPAR